ncbi:unnamed protein product [Caenorhabditis bovis]|uniref:K Homology domain-containing protein n=1 Tax=Caenorhabditis bovis TaxID=2654633 RepID=A0A8S1F1A7_9PELO|nr:unnamed protein product [Caenorhabditis bovis]
MAARTVRIDVTRSLPTPLIGRFIGQEGSEIKKLSKQNNVIIELDADENRKIVSIVGQYNDVKKATIEVRRNITELRNRNCEYEMKIPNDLIGKHGSKINEIKERTSVNIKIDKDEAEFANVTIYGSYSKILTALRLIWDRIDSIDRQNPHDDPSSKEFSEELNVDLC